LWEHAGEGDLWSGQRVDNIDVPRNHGDSNVQQLAATAPTVRDRLQPGQLESQPSDGLGCRLEVEGTTHQAIPSYRNFPNIIPLVPLANIPECAWAAPFLLARSAETPD